MLLFPENKKIKILQTPADVVYNDFNALFTHLFSALSKSHSMSLFHISPGKGSTVPKIVNTTFPAIRATNNKPTPMVTSKTVGYIHALVIDTLTFHSADATYARAIANSEVIRAEFDKLNLDKFCTELSACLLDYYEKVCGMAGVGGVTSVQRRKFAAKPAAAAAAAENDTEGASSQHTADAVGDIDAVSPPAAAGAAADAPASASSPASGKKGGKGGKAKKQ